MNKNISKIHLEILDNPRQRVLKKLIPFMENFILGGGTALALQIAHRQSYDFDFFSPHVLPRKLLESLSLHIEIENVVIDTPDELTFFTEGVKVTVLYYPFKSHMEPIQTGNHLFLFSIHEIAVKKAYTIGRRGEYRDYFDLYTILKGQYVTLKKLIQTAKEEYNGAFDEKIFLEQLLYFDDLSNFEIIPTSNRILPSKEEVKQYFEELVKNYVS